MQTTLTVILPCYNEAKAIQAVLTDWTTQLESLKQKLQCSEIEILVVDDGSTDDGCEDIEKNFPVRCVRHSKNLGYGQTLKTGLREAKGEWIAFHDCDSTCKASNMADLWALKDQNDLVVGRRIESGTQMPLLRQFGNSLYRNLFVLLFRQSPHDLCSGYRLFHRNWIPQFTTQLPDQLNFTLAMSLWMTRRNLKISEAPIFYDVRMGESKLSAWDDGWRFLFTVFKYRLSSIEKSEP